jgi:hypothetical protein
MGTWLETLWQDIRYGSRMLGRAPGFTAIAIVSLAVGIGANCAIFSFADALLLRPLPVARPGDVLTAGSTVSLEALGVSGLAASYRDYVDIRDRNRSFSDLGALLIVVPVVLAVTFLAAFVPARRASRTSPTLALRQE